MKLVIYYTFRRNSYMWGRLHGYTVIRISSEIFENVA